LVVGCCADADPDVARLPAAADKKVLRLNMAFLPVIDLPSI
jgi:hypothetical protein